MMILPLLLPVFLTCTTVSTPSTPSDPLESFDSEHIKLKSVHVVFRHGDSELATPDFYTEDPKDPERTHADFNPHVDSYLTNSGRKRSYELGQFLRSHYRNFLDKEYRRKDVDARSTYLERARASLLLVLAGLYPPEGHQKWHPTLDWQPIAIVSPEANDEDPLMWPIRCPTYLKERKRIERTEEFAKGIQYLVDLFVMLGNSTNPAHDFTDEKLTDLYTKLRVGIDADVSIPDWSPDVFSNVTSGIVRDAIFLRYETQNFNKWLIRLNGGMLLRKIVDDMKAVIEGKKMPKINLYAGHEFNVVALLYALGAWKEVLPSYLSFVAVELWEINSQYYIKVLYRDGNTGQIIARRIKKCSHIFCPFEEFEILRCKYLPTSLSECYKEEDNEKECLEKADRQTKSDEV